MMDVTEERYNGLYTDANTGGVLSVSSNVMSIRRTDKHCGARDS